MGYSIDRKHPESRGKAPKAEQLLSAPQGSTTAQPAPVTLAGLEHKAPETPGFQQSY